MPAISDLYAKIGFKVDKSGLKEFTDEMLKLKNTIAECLAGLDGFAQAAEKLAKAARGMRSAASNSEARQRLKEKQLEIAERRVQIAEQREARLREKEKEKKERDGFVQGVSQGTFLGELKDKIYSSIKSAFNSIVGVLKGIIREAWRAMWVYRDYRNYTNLRDAELNRWTTLAEGYAKRPEIAKNMMEVQQSLLGIRLGQGNLLAAKLAGISADTTDPYEYLNRFREAFIRNNVSPEWQKYILNLAGFGDWAVGAIKNSRNEEEFRAAYKYHEVDTERKAEIAKKLSVAASRLFDSFSRLDELLVKFTNWIGRWLTEVVNVFQSNIFRGKGTWGRIKTFLDIITSNPAELHKMALANTTGEAYEALKAQTMTPIPHSTYIDNRKIGSFMATSEQSKMEDARNFYGGEDVTDVTMSEPSTQDDIYNSLNNLATAYSDYENTQKRGAERLEARYSAAVSAAVARGMDESTAQRILSEYRGK